MKKIRKIIKIISEIVFFIFILIVFLYSTYRVFSYFKIIKFQGWGVSCEGIPSDGWDCDLCESSGELCGDLGRWCDLFCCWPPICPTPTPTPTPTPIPSATPTPTATGILTPTPTPTLPLEPTATPTVTPTPTSKPAEAPGVGGPGPAGPPVCSAVVPSAPTLLSVTSVGSGEVELVWTPVVNVTHYSISYGPSSGNYLHGVPNTGNVTSFRVGNLDPTVNYCFAVRAVNDCAPGPLSNEICLLRVLGVVAPGQVLGVTTLAGTGSFDRKSLELILFTIGCLCLGVGLNLRFAKEQVE